MLPIHPHPKPDELLSSWLTRVAHRNQFKVHSFCASYFGRERNVWNRDIDKLGPDWLIEGMAKLTGISLTEAGATALRSYEGVVYGNINPNGNTKWIMPLGIYHRLHRRRGLQYCPVCLALSDEPHFKKQWRLAFYTMCETHQVMLRDSCPECDCPIVFYRGDIGYKTRFSVRSIRHCYSCGADLARAPVEMYQWNDRNLELMFQCLLNLHWRRWSCAPLPESPHPHLILDSVHQLCSLMAHQRKMTSSLLFEIEHLCGLPVRPMVCGPYIEGLRVQERHRLMVAVSWLLVDWPERMQSMSKTCGIWSKVAY